MRVALLYCGLPRMWRECHASQIALFEGAEVHVFCHFWDVVSAEEKNEILATMQPSRYIFEPLPDLTITDRYENFRRDVITVPSRLLSQYASWMKLAALFTPFAPLFNIAMRSRTDLEFHAPITPALEAIQQQRAELALFEWPYQDATQTLFSDTCALGTPRAVLYFLNILTRVWDYAPKSVFNPELLLTTHIHAYPGTLNLATLKQWPFFIRRPSMANWPLERCIAASAGDTKWQEPEIIEAHQRHHAERYGQDGLRRVELFRGLRIKGLV